MQGTGSERRGSVLTVVLLVLFLLAGLAWRSAFATRLQVRLAGRQYRQTQAYHCALSGIWQGVAGLQADKLNNSYDSGDDDWTRQFQKAGRLQEQPVRAADGQLAGIWTLVVVDEQSRVNINTAPVSVLTRLAAVSGCRQPEALAARLSAFRNTDPPGPASRSPMDCLFAAGDQLPVLLGEDANLNYRLDIEENDGVRLSPADNANNVLDLGMAAYLTVFGGDRINVNTAAVEVLSSLPGINQEQARLIVQQRSQAPIANLDDLAPLLHLTPAAWQQLNPWLDIRSNRFLLISEGYDAERTVQCRIRAVVDRSAAEPRILYWREEYQ